MRVARTIRPRGGKMASQTQRFDAIVIGAGFSGMYMLKTLRDRLGLKVCVYEAGQTVSAAVGGLSDTNMPSVKGLETVRGEWWHTSRFPHSGVDFTAKRVAVVGTGATAVQAIPEIAQQAKQLTVFQRTAAYCVPARNGKVDPDLVKKRKASYDDIINRTKTSFFGFEYSFIPKSALEVPAEER